MTTLPFVRWLASPGLRAFSLVFAIAWSRAIAANGTLPVSPSVSGSPPAAASALFAYDRSLPLDLQEVGTETHDEAVIRDITFMGANRRVSAYLVTPERTAGPYAAIMYVHWLGDRETTNRTEFLKEAIALASQGVVSLLVDATWAQPNWYESRIPEEDHASSIRQVIELRRALDLLLDQPGVDKERVAYVGHDFGAMYGVVMGAVDARPTTYVLMAGTPHFVDWFLFARQPKSLDDYRRQLAPLDPINFVGQLAPASVFFQFAAHDEYVSADAAAKFYTAAVPRKQTAMYDAGHDLQKPEVTADRISWLMRTLHAQR